MDINLNEKPKKSLKKIITIIICIIMSIILLIVYARYKATSDIKIHEYKITDSTLPAKFHGIKVVQFSDVYYGNTVNLKNLENIVNQINNLNPDIVVFTGDLITKNIDNDTTNNIISTLNNIKSKLGKFAIKGNNDNNLFDTIITSSNFKDLTNTKTEIYYNGNESITISNIDEYTDNFCIYLLHEPDKVDNLANSYNVILAGHSLGGQINLPIIKNILLPKGAKKYYNGYYKNKNLYVSSGIGTTDFKYRFLNKPSINLYRLTKY